MVDLENFVKISQLTFCKGGDVFRVFLFRGLLGFFLWIW